MAGKLAHQKPASGLQERVGQFERTLDEEGKRVCFYESTFGIVVVVMVLLALTFVLADAPPM